MRLYGDYQDVTLIVQLGSHRHPSRPNSDAAEPHPDRLRATRDESSATAFFINPVFAVGTVPVRENSPESTQKLSRHKPQVTTH